MIMELLFVPDMRRELPILFATTWLRLCSISGVCVAFAAWLATPTMCGNQIAFVHLEKSPEERRQTNFLDKVADRFTRAIWNTPTWHAINNEQFFRYISFRLHLFLRNAILSENEGNSEAEEGYRGHQTYAEDTNRFLSCGSAVLEAAETATP